MCFMIEVVIQTLGRFEHTQTHTCSIAVDSQKEKNNKKFVKCFVEIRTHTIPNRLFMFTQSRTVYAAARRIHINFHSAYSFISLETTLICMQFA